MIQKDEQYDKQYDEERRRQTKINILSALKAGSLAQMRECRTIVTLILQSLVKGKYEEYYLRVTRLLLSTYARRKVQAIEELPLTFRELIGPTIQSRPLKIFTRFPLNLESQRACVTQWRDILFFLNKDPLQDSEISTAGAKQLHKYFEELRTFREEYRQNIIFYEGENLEREKIWFEQIGSEIDKEIKSREQQITVSSGPGVETLPPIKAEQRTPPSLREVRRGQAKVVTVHAQRGASMVAKSGKDPDSEEDRLRAKVDELSTNLLIVANDTREKIQAATNAKDVAEQKLLDKEANLVEKEEHLAEILKLNRSLEQERREGEEREKANNERREKLANAVDLFSLSIDGGCRDEQQKALESLQGTDTESSAESRYLASVDECIRIMYKKLRESQETQNLAKKAQQSTYKALQRAKESLARYKTDAEGAEKNAQRLYGSLHRLSGHVMEMQKYTGEYEHVPSRSGSKSSLKGCHLRLTDKSLEPAVTIQSQRLTNEQWPSPCDTKAETKRTLLPNEMFDGGTRPMDEKNEYHKKLDGIPFNDRLDRRNVYEKDAGDPSGSVRTGQLERCTSKKPAETVADPLHVQGALLLIAMLVSLLAIQGRKDLSRDEASSHTVVSDSASFGLGQSVENVNKLVQTLQKFNWNLASDHSPSRQLLACVNGWKDSQRCTREAQLLLELLQLIDDVEKGRRIARGTGKPPRLRSALQQKPVSTKLETQPSEVQRKDAGTTPRAFASEHGRHLRKQFEAHMLDQFRDFCHNLGESISEPMSSMQSPNCVLEMFQIDWEVMDIYTTTGMEKSMERVAMRSVENNVFIFPRLHQVLCLEETARAKLFHFCKSRGYVKMPIALRFSGVMTPTKGGYFAVITEDNCTSKQRFPGKAIAGWGEKPALAVNQEAAFRESKSKAVEDVQEHMSSRYQQVGLSPPWSANRDADLDDAVRRSGVGLYEGGKKEALCTDLHTQGQSVSLGL